MKKLLFLLFVVLLLNACSAGNNSDTHKDTVTNTTAMSKKLADTTNNTTVVIGQVKAGVATFLADSNVLRNDWQKFLSNDQVIGPCILHHIEFLQHGTEYYLVAHGYQGKDPIRSMIDLNQSHGSCLYIGGGNGRTTICTTSACANETEGCLPEITSCTPCANKGKCTKAITFPVGIFPSIPPSACPD